MFWLAPSPICHRSRRWASTWMRAAICLGVVLYVMTTGANPFEGETSAAVFDAILHRASDLPLKSKLFPDSIRFDAGIVRRRQI